MLGAGDSRFPGHVLALAPRGNGLGSAAYAVGPASCFPPNPRLLHRLYDEEQIGLKVSVLASVKCVWLLHFIASCKGCPKDLSEFLSQFYFVSGKVSSGLNHLAVAVKP